MGGESGGAAPLKEAWRAPEHAGGSVAEWSKALDLGSSHFDGVGSNPTAAKLFCRRGTAAPFRQPTGEAALAASGGGPEAVRPARSGLGQGMAPAAARGGWVSVEGCRLCSLN